MGGKNRAFALPGIGYMPLALDVGCGIDNGADTFWRAFEAANRFRPDTDTITLR
ncbi:hypothetical protein GCM10011400_61050 [Paraburkholderia caffeinilytica]|uniref:Uncharacterized protein n=1 Tax=Paraburkholderia caffeinilytica TaxID=1761016 RepID=A0ABQ1NI37_9BURK|nr:hypothetical protein GCM10011400_61050 [Paraburkholderia caffeinilytica]